jgi:hypothetical protein
MAKTGTKVKELTGKQRAFVDAILDPEIRSYADAYRAVYSTASMSPKVVRNEASKLRAHPGVTMALDAARSRVERERARDGVAERQAIRRRLWAEVDDQDTPSASRVQALRLLGLASGTGMFSESQRIEVSEPMPASEAETMAEIEALLRDD